MMMTIYKNIIIPFIIILLSIGNNNVFSQSNEGTENPFDLTFRLKKEEQQAILDYKNNPFDIIHPNQSLQKKLKQNNNDKNSFFIKLFRYEGDQPVSKNLFIYILGAFLIWVTFVVTLFRDRINIIFKTFPNINLISIEHRKSIGRANPHQFFFFSIAAISYALFSLALIYKTHLNTENIVKACILAIVISGIYLFIKYALIYLVGIIFPFKKDVSRYLFLYEQTNVILSLILIPFTVFIIFSPSFITSTILIIASITILVWWILRIILGFRIGGKFLTINIFRFFAYLCSVELAPIIILFTTVQIIIGKSLFF